MRAWFSVHRPVGPYKNEGMGQWSSALFFGIIKLRASTLWLSTSKSVTTTLELEEDGIPSPGWEWGATSSKVQEYLVVLLNKGGRVEGKLVWTHFKCVKNSDILEELAKPVKVVPPSGYDAPWKPYMRGILGHIQQGGGPEVEPGHFGWPCNTSVSSGKSWRSWPWRRRSVPLCLSCCSHELGKVDDNGWMDGWTWLGMVFLIKQDSQGQFK